MRTHLNWKRICSAALLLVLAVSLVPKAWAAPAGEVGYRVSGSYNDASRTLTVSVYVYGTDAAGGRLALGFDNDKLALPENIPYISSVATHGPNVALSTEGHTMLQYFSQSMGHVMLAWYGSDGALEIGDGEHLIATVKFTLKDGVKPEEFDNQTLYLYSVANDYLGWDTCAWVCGPNLEDYSNCVAGVSGNVVTFSYPGSTEPATGLLGARIFARDTSDSPLSGGQVTIGQYTVPMSAGGEAAFTLAEGTYTCMVSVPGYEQKVFWLTVSGGTVYRSVELRSVQGLVDDIAKDITIGFQGSDTADHVTRDIYLPNEGAQKTKITWSTSNPARLSAYGNVFRSKEAAQVTLTATVSKDGYTATKTFTVTVTADSIPAADSSGFTPVVPGEETKEDRWETEGPACPFTDIGPVRSWAGEAITEMYDRGIIKGTSATTYSPNDPVTRGDFITLLMRMLDPQCEPGPGFNDVSPNASYYKHVLKAQTLGIAKGVGGGNFNPKGQITRQDMVTLTYRALEAMGYELTPVDGTKTMDSFSDSGSTAKYAIEAMEAALGAGCIKGKGGALAPKVTTTRAEAAAFLYRVLENITGGELG